MLANNRKRTYIARQTAPTFQSNLNLFRWNAKYRPINVESRDVAEYAIELDFNGIK